jgi:PKD domain
MNPRHLCQSAGKLLVVLSALAAAACEKSPLLAPTGSSITLTSATTALPANGSATIMAQVLEAAGTPPHSGTRVSFTTTLGTIDPPESSTDSSGRATVTFRANGASGIAIISANSGGASTSATGGTGNSGGSNGSNGGGTTTTPTGDRSLRIAVGTAAVGRVLATANPAVLPTTGGVATIVANVVDINGNALSAAAVTFTTTAGTLSAASVNTDASGNASVSLTTSQTATVTATVGVGSTGGTGNTGNTGGTTGGTQTSNNQATATVTLRNAPSILIELPATPPSQGLPSAYSFTVTAAGAAGGTGGTGGGSGGSGGNGGTSTGSAAIRDVTVSWGDGQNSNLGTFTGKQAVSHVYTSAQTFTITATVTDVSGEVGRASSAVSVIPVPQLAVVVTPSPQTIGINGLITFNVQVTVPAGIGVQNTSIDFGDGEVRQLGGATSASVTKSYSTPGVRTVTVAVLDTAGRTTIGTATVSITP